MFRFVKQKNNLTKNKLVLQCLSVERGKSIQQEDGMLKEESDCIATAHFYKSITGSMLQLVDKDYEYQIATYSMQRDLKYLYTYDYQREQNWATYNRDFDHNNSFRQEDYIFQEDCYFRIALRKRDRNTIDKSEVERINDIIRFYSISYELKKISKPYFEEEVYKTVHAIYEKTTKKSLVFGLLSDTHYVVNGTWKDTNNNITKVNQQVGFDGIIHLGDITDGILSKKMCIDYTAKVLGDLRENHVPVYLAIGNHDTNYFYNNPESLSYEEQYAIYARYNDRYVCREDNQLWYYADFSNVKLRCIFLYAFDHREKIRYGYSAEEVEWVARILDSTPEGYKVIVFSHDAPLASLDYWASEIRNGNDLVKVLESYDAKENKCVMAFIHGHTHADYVYKERTFPIISIGCSKCEYFPDKKIEKSIRYERELDSVTQELWDTMIITPEEDRIEFIRFGAGVDRTVDCNYWRKKQMRRTKVWAHRGASGYAPENTIPAFQMAIDMSADGVELDVQLTKDGQVVVIHDETINRVSNGEGNVVDYTLEELRQFNFNKTHPEYEKVNIPTLVEVLNLFKDTKHMINIELKTGVNTYEGIEEKTVALVKEKGMQERIIYSSFNHDSVMKLKEVDPQAKTGFLGVEDIPNNVQYGKKHGVDALHPWLMNTQYPALVKDAKRNGLAIHVWTVNTEADIKRMIEMEVDAIITNYPDKAVDVIDGRISANSLHNCCLCDKVD